MNRKADKLLPGQRSRVEAALRQIFFNQYGEAQKRDIGNTMDIDWVRSGEWVNRIYDQTHNDLFRVAVRSGTEASRRVGMYITDLGDRPSVQHAIRNEGYKFAEAVSQSTADKLRTTLSEAVATGESPKDIEGRVKQVFGYDPEADVLVPAEEGDELPNWRAERIARTEYSRASTIGNKTAWRESGVVSAMIWLASPDACPFCLDMNGEYCGLDSVFFAQGDEQTIEIDGKQYALKFDYSDIPGPPLHVNCMCSTKAELI